MTATHTSTGLRKTASLMGVSAHPMREFSVEALATLVTGDAAAADWGQGPVHFTTEEAVARVALAMLGLARSRGLAFAQELLTEDQADAVRDQVFASRRFSLARLAQV